MIYQKIIANSILEKPAHCDYSIVDADFESWLSTLGLTNEQSGAIRKAYNFARLHHDGQFRKLKGPSGEWIPYLVHPLGIAKKVSKLAPKDIEWIQAAFLHDLVEDVEVVTVELVSREFGPVVAQIVDGVSKIGKEAEAQKRGHQTLLKIIEYASRDIRVAILKLFDRLDNMETLCAFDGRPDKQERIALETLQVYVPIARWLGMRDIAEELDNLVFYYLNREEYQRVKASAESEWERVSERIAEIAQSFEMAMVNRFGESVLGDADHSEFVLVTRQRSFREAAAALRRKDGGRRNPEDWFAVTFVVPGTLNTFSVFETFLTESRLRIVPGGIDYETVSLGDQEYRMMRITVQDRVIGKVQFQIATTVDYERYCHGVAALAALPQWYVPGDRLREKLEKLRHDYIEDTEADLRAAITDLGPNDPIKLLTPAGHILNLPSGAFPLDFAAAIHRRLPWRTSEVTVDGTRRPLSEPFHLRDQGAVVHVVDDPPGHPSVLWLKWVRTQDGKRSVRAALRARPAEDSIAEGKRLLDAAFLKMALQPAQIEHPRLSKFLGAVIHNYPFPLGELKVRFRDQTDLALLHLAIGVGDADPDVFVQGNFFGERLQAEYVHRAAALQKSGVLNPSTVAQGVFREGHGYGLLLGELERLGFGLHSFAKGGDHDFTLILNIEGVVRRFQLDTLLGIHCDRFSLSA